MNKRALIIVDFQNDFAHRDGRLYVEGAENIWDHIAPLVHQHDYVVLTQDWHPKNDPSFKAQGGPWPEHCVRGEWGAEFFSHLPRDVGNVVIRKSGYSAFKDEYNVDTGLHGHLRDLWIDRLTVVGLALDYCVRETAEVGALLGYQVEVPLLATRAVDRSQVDYVKRQLHEQGIKVT